MDNKLQKITTFIQKHHVMSLATSDGEELSVCSLFYAYDDEHRCFVVASSEDTIHIRHIKQRASVAGNILLESDEVAKIEGLQFRGVFKALEDRELKSLYFKTFPYALALRPKLWVIKVDYFKLTDNRLGFGKKIIWQDVLE